MGKPFCLKIDEQGKQHFPNHAQVSYDIFLETFKEIPDRDLIAKLIKNDMMYHKGSVEDIDKFIKENNRIFCLSLWMTSFAELYSNKEMFDDCNQLSFKIKYKKLVKILKKI